jgi:hypothetical protein
MFWFGITRHRAVALKTIEMAFGPGDLDLAEVQCLCEHMDVKVRLIYGLRSLARRESLEPLCEYMTNKQREWFASMRRDPLGRVDINELQNFFVRQDVMNDRLALFRFLRHEMRRAASRAAQSGDNKHNGAAAANKPNKSKCSKPNMEFCGEALDGIEFNSMLCVCVLSWCVFRAVRFVMHGHDKILPTWTNVNQQVASKWTELQRKITVSLLVNHRFWGREAKLVLASLHQPDTDDNTLTSEQWMMLFQRVRAQGIQSTLPEGDETDDLDFLGKKVRLDVGYCEYEAAAVMQAERNTERSIGLEEGERKNR